MNFDDMLTTPETAPVAPQPATQLPGRNRPRIGGPPQVSLLPSEIRDANKGKVARRAMAGGVLLALIVTGGGIGGAYLLSVAAQKGLDDVNAQTQTLTQSIAKFADVQALDQSVETAKAARMVGSSTEVDWQKQLGYIEKDMPADYVVKSITADSATPIADYAQGSSPLELPRAATVQMMVNAPTVLELPAWLRKLRSIPTYADATASVDQSTDDGAYSVNLVIHLTEKAIVHSKKADK